MLRRTRLVRQPTTTLSDHTALLSLQSTRVRMYGQGHTRRGRTMGADLGESAGVGAWVCGCDAQSCFFLFSLFHTLRQGRSVTQLNTASSAIGAGDVAAAHTRTLDMNKRDTRHHGHVDDLCMHMFPKTEVHRPFSGHHHTNSFTITQPCETCSPSCLLTFGGRQQHTGCQRG